MVDSSSGSGSSNKRLARQTRLSMGEDMATHFSWFLRTAGTTAQDEDADAHLQHDAADFLIDLHGAHIRPTQHGGPYMPRLPASFHPGSSTSRLSPRWLRPVEALAR